MIEQLKNLIKRGRVISANTDTLQYPRTNLEMLSGNRPAEELYHYGSFGVAPVGSLAISFSVMGDESNQVAITYSPKLRPVELKVGEYACGNFLRKNFVRFNDDGTVKLTTPQGAIIETTAEGGINISAQGQAVNIEAETANVTAEGDANIKATNANIDAKVNLGTGGAAIARVGDSVQTNPVTGAGTITAGSTEHTAS